MLTAEPQLFTFFTFYVFLFCSHFVVNIMEYASVIQVRGLASYKTSFNPPIST